jgi:HAD superfamily hydrolase (TIGR01509 family)
MDGLMIDTEKLYAVFWEKALVFYGYHPTREFLRKLSSLSHELADTLFQATFGENINYLQIREKRIELMNAYIQSHGVEKKVGLDELLAYLHNRKICMAIATSTDYERTNQYLNQLKIKDYFKEIVCGPMVEHGKPAPDIYLKVVSLLGVTPEECLALEDSPNGVTAAYKAGCKVIMIPEYEDHSVDNSVKFDIARSLSEVVEFIKP